MKINEKNLISYAVSETPIDKEGYLLKRSDVNKHFLRRYFVLKGNLLFYFERKGDKEPIGVIILEGYTVELIEHDEIYAFKIEFYGATSNRSYVLGAESQEAMEQWMKALACASYDYIKAMVDELRGQLEELEEPPKLTLIGQNASGSPVPPPRQRQNPFNRTDSSNSPRNSHSSPRHNSSASNSESRPTESGAKNCISFRELHNFYGRPILTHFNSWKYEQKKLLHKDQVNVGNLIDL